MNLYGEMAIMRMAETMEQDMVWCKPICWTCITVACLWGACGIALLCWGLTW